MRQLLLRIIEKWYKNDLLTIKVKNLFNTIDENDILKVENGSFTVAGKPLSIEEQKLIVSEAIVFSKSRLWKILQDDIKYKANKSMFEKSQTDIDLTAGKLWLYTLDAIKTKIEDITK